ncbi:MAG TPA: ABC transporter permease [Candidatus Angelobacter sp.]
MIASLIHDFRYGLRQLWRNPGFSIVAVLTLALGIGANTAIFSVLDPLLLRKLPVQRPDELVRIDAAGTLSNIGAWESFAFERLRDQTGAFSGVMAFVPVSLDDLVHDGRSAAARGEIISGNYFDVLGVQPYAGKLRPAGQDLGNSVILGFNYWQREFGANADVLGKTIQVQGAQCTVIGITAPEFFGMRVGEAADVYLPSSPGKSVGITNAPSLDWVTAIGRLKTGVSLAQARSSLQPVFQEIKKESQIPEVEQQQVMDHLLLTSAAQGLSALRHRFSLPARILMGVVGLVLLIACSNVANLLLAQGSARRREMTVRLALGAQRWRLIRQLLTENAILAIVGALGGLLLAQWTSRSLVAALSDSQTQVTLSTSLNGRVLLFSLSATLLAALVSGLVPAFSTTRIEISQEIKTYAADSRRGFRARLGSLLVVAQVAMSVTALVAGGLLLHSLVNLETMPVGFDRDHVLAIDMNGNGAGYTPQQLKNFYDRLMEKTEAQPGVRSATLSSFAPISGREYGINLRVEGYSARPGEEMKAFLTTVRPGYFNTMGIELLQGRDFTFQDSPTSPRVAIINRSLARHYFGEQDPTGKRLEFVEGNQAFQIVGVAGDTKYKDLRENTLDIVYLDNLQRASSTPVIRSTLSIRAAGDLTSLRSTLPEVVRALDPSVRVTRMATLRERIDDSLHTDRLIATLCGTLSVLALTLTCVGLYGLLSFSVTRKTSEIGIRMALGAERGHIFRLFISHGMRLVVLGLLIGLAMAFASTSLIKTFLYGVGRADPFTMIGICLLLAMAAFAACFLPARRATRVEPLVALRNE